MSMFLRTCPVCLRCILQQRRSYATSVGRLFPPASGKVRLDTRRLVSVQGYDASRFLQGLTTNNVRSHQTNGWYCAFLSATGRVLWDAFIYPVHWSRKYRNWLSGGAHVSSSSSSSVAVPKDYQDEPSYLVEVDASVVDAFVRHLKRHKLRAKVSVKAVEPDAFSVWSVWRKEERWTPHTSTLAADATAAAAAVVTDEIGKKSASSTFGSMPDPDSVIQLVDGRAPGFGRRLVLSTDDHPDSSPFADLSNTSARAYHVRRYLHGIPEGSAEIRRDAVLPLEYNIDYMGGIDFRKGCYIGQELTIRTHHTGVVRKRILPVALYPTAERDPPTVLEYDEEDTISSPDGLPPVGTDIKRVGGKGRSAGRWIAGMGNIGLALCRLETMTDIRLTAEIPEQSPHQRFEMRWTNGDTEEQIGVKAFVPDWHRGKERVRSPPKRVA